MKRITELDKADIRHDAREIYTEYGFEGLLDTLEETMAASEAMLEVLRDEYEKQQ